MFKLLFYIVYCFWQGKHSLKRKNKTKTLKDADLVSFVPASSLNNPDLSSFAYVQHGTEPWTKYWCVAFGNCLYIYQNESSDSTIKTVVLPGYKIVVGGLTSSKYKYNLSLSHEGIAPVWMSLNDQDELDKWVALLEMYTRAEGYIAQKRAGRKLLSGEPSRILTHHVTSKKATNRKKGPIKADHNLGAIKRVSEVCFLYYFVVIDLGHTLGGSTGHNFLDFFSFCHSKRILCLSAISKLYRYRKVYWLLEFQETLYVTIGKPGG